MSLAHVMATHLGDQDPERHLRLSGSQAGGQRPWHGSSGIPELRQAPRPPLLRELGLAAPVLAALRAYGVDPADTVELSREEWPPLAAAETSGGELRQRKGTLRGAVVLTTVRRRSCPVAATAVAVICSERPDGELINDALAAAGEFIFLLSPCAPTLNLDGWSLVEEQPGLAAPIERLAASREFTSLATTAVPTRPSSTVVSGSRHAGGQLRRARTVTRLRLAPGSSAARKPESLVQRNRRPRGRRAGASADRTTLAAANPPRARAGHRLTKASRLVRAERYSAACPTVTAGTREQETHTLPIQAPQRRESTGCGLPRQGMARRARP